VNTAGLSPELLALLACARAVVDRETLPAFASALEACRSVDELCRAAVGHGMLGHLHRLLVTATSPMADPGLVRRLSKLQRSMAARNLRYAAVLLKILRQLDGAGVRAMAAKGPVWAELLYGDLTTRAWSDLDLLVERGQVAHAREVLGEMGFQDCSPFNEQATRARWGDTGQIALGTRELGLVVDLHWKMTVAVSPKGLTAEPVLARAGTVVLLGEQIRCPGQSDVFLITCLEGTRDHWSSVARLLDLAVLVDRTPPDAWTDLLEAAKVAGCKRRALAAVGYACGLLGLETPQAVVAGLESDSRAGALLGRLRPSQLRGAPPSGLRGRLTLLRAHAGGEDRVSDRLRFVLARLFAPTGEDWRAFDLPRPMEWLYVPLRPLRLAGKWFRRILWTGKARDQAP
jgi:hypothetical protein